MRYFSGGAGKHSCVAAAWVHVEDSLCCDSPRGGTSACRSLPCLPLTGEEEHQVEVQALCGDSVSASGRSYSRPQSQLGPDPYGVGVGLTLS